MSASSLLSPSHLLTPRRSSSSSQDDELDRKGERGLFLPRPPHAPSCPLVPPPAPPPLVRVPTSFSLARPLPRHRRGKAFAAAPGSGRARTGCLRPVWSLGVIVNRLDVSLPRGTARANASRGSATPSASEAAKLRSYPPSPPFMHAIIPLIHHVDFLTARPFYPSPPHRPSPSPPPPRRCLRRALYPPSPSLPPQPSPRA